MATVKGDVHDVVSSLLNPGLKPQFDAAHRANQQRVREPHSALKRRPMLPAASVSGLYLAHPDATYFTVGRVGLDQVEDYARRKGMAMAEVERWLAPNLSYKPVLT